MKTKNKKMTGKSWAWFFYQELGYRIVEDKEQEYALKKAMDNAISKKTEEFMEKIRAGNKLIKLLGGTAERQEEEIEKLSKFETERVRKIKKLFQQSVSDIAIIIDYRIKNINPNYAREIKRMHKQELEVIKGLLLDEKLRPMELIEQLKKKNEPKN